MKQEKHFLPLVFESWLPSWDEIYFIRLGMEAALLPLTVPQSHSDRKYIVEEKGKKKRNQHANSPCPLLKENKGMMISIRLWLPETILIFQYFWPLLCKLALWQIEPLRRMGLCIRVSGVHGIPLGFDSSESGSLNKSVWRQAEMSKGNWRDKKKVQCLNWTP